MRRRGRAAAALLLIAGAVVARDAAAAETISTNTYTLRLPDGWKVVGRSSSITARGPAGETFQLTSVAPPAAQLGQIEERAPAAMRTVESNADLETVAPLKRSVLPSGATLHEMLSRTKDGRGLFGQFTTVGPGTVILVTVKASEAASLDAIREALAGIRWK